MNAKYNVDLEHAEKEAIVNTALLVAVSLVQVVLQYALSVKGDMAYFRVNATNA